MINKIERKFDNKIIPFTIIFFVALIAYSNSFTAPFALDDFGSITNNYAIHSPFDVISLWKFYSNRFVLYFTLSINYIIHDNGVEGYHAVNLAIHILNGILFYMILYYILGLSFFNKKIIAKYRNIICTMSSLIFISHPLQVNAVTYIVQRTASLAATFYLLAILFFIKFRLTDKIKNFLFMMLFIVLAMFTKENTITIPFMLIVIEFMFFLKDGKTSWKKRIIFLLIITLITVPIIPATNLYLGGYSQSDPGVSFKASTSMDRFQYFYTELNVIVLYIKLLFIPDNQNFDYSNDFPNSHTIWENNSYISFIILSFIGLIALLNIKRNKLISLGIIWFYIGLAVESSFISIKDVYFEHRVYFPMAGFIIFMIGLIFCEFKNEGHLRLGVILFKRLKLFKRPFLFFLIVFCLMTVTFTGLTIKRNYIYSDEKRLWTDVVKKAPNSDRAHSVLGTAYLNSYESDENNSMKYLNLAEEELKKSLELNEKNSTSLCNLSKVYLLKKDYDKAFEYARKSNSIESSKYAYYNLGQAYEAVKKPADAIIYYKYGYEIDKKCGFIVKALGDIYLKEKDYSNAEKYFKELIKISKFYDNDEINKNLSIIKEKLERK